MKLAGSYGVERTAPPWAKFGMLAAFADEETIAHCARRSRETGIQWVIQFGFDRSPLIPVEEYADAQWNRFEELHDHVIGVVYGEEWEERRIYGEFTKYGLSPAIPEGSEIVRSWVGRQYSYLKGIVQRPIMHISGISQYIPSATDYFGLVAYPDDLADPSAHLAAVIWAAEKLTHLPIVLIARGFAYEGPAQGPNWQDYKINPSEQILSCFKTAIERPRIVASLWFLWESRPASQLRGFQDMPEIHGAIARAVGAE